MYLYLVNRGRYRGGARDRPPDIPLDNKVAGHLLFKVCSWTGWTYGLCTPQGEGVQSCRSSYGGEVWYKELRAGERLMKAETEWFEGIWLDRLQEAQKP